MKIKYNPDNLEILEIGEEVSGPPFIEVFGTLDLNTFSLKDINGSICWEPDPEKNNAYYKNQARIYIQNAVGDDKDLIADLAKRVALLERLTLRIANEKFSGVPLAQDYVDRYGAFAAQYVYAVDNSLFVDRADLEDEGVLFATLMERFATIAHIVKTEYLDKKI